MDRLWLKLTGGVPGHAEQLRSLGRVIEVPRAAMGAARFSFAALCDRPRRTTSSSATPTRR